jgi:hypothetical protein
MQFDTIREREVICVDEGNDDPHRLTTFLLDHLEMSKGTIEWDN